MSGCCVPTGEVYLSGISLMIRGNTMIYRTPRKRTRGVMFGTYRPFKFSCVIRDRHLRSPGC
nr:MAG TPA: hypothetical protein [Caudoviricetes sp.]DAY54167.1 MAG TPA: hypothetical protein [Caudoviricetes sp.]